VEEIRRFQEEVRQRTRSLLQDDMLGSSRRLSEALWLGFEHEVMHIETFLYMLLQSPKTHPPHNVPRPDFGAIAKRAHINAVPNEWFEIPEQVVSVGLDDPDPSVIPQSFGWDNEKPRRSVSIGAFRAKGRAITNGEYAKYLELNNVPMIPASWMAKESNGTVRNGHAAAQGDGERASPEFLDKYLVRTVFGPVPLKFALDWPVAASFNELDGYAKSVNCRIPSFEEAQSIYQHAAVLKSSTTNGVHQSNGHSTW
jgi:formylglycine-generating enzyme required for sulfatase activity